MKSTVKEIQE